MSHERTVLFVHLASHRLFDAEGLHGRDDDGYAVELGKLDGQGFGNIQHSDGGTRRLDRLAIGMLAVTQRFERLFTDGIGRDEHRTSGSSVCRYSVLARAIECAARMVLPPPVGRRRQT